ncbi:MAG: EF-hand domain-containing protein [Gammaproteobacteria bacterium]
MIDKISMIILASTLTGVAVAAEDAFAQLDRDGNGAISKSEATTQPALYEAWTQTDMNADGVIDQAEFSKFEVMPAQPEESTQESTQ